MTHDRGGSLRRAKSLIEFRQAAFQAAATSEPDWFQLHGNKFSRNAGPTPSEIKVSRKFVSMELKPVRFRSRRLLESGWRNSISDLARRK